MKKVSIITIAYNSADTIEDTIKSIIKQDYPKIEYIVIDGGSDDGTLNVLARYEDAIDILVTEPDKGIYDAMNKGVSYASGEIIGILNSDDFYADERVVSDVMAKMESENLEGLYADLVYVERDNPQKIVRSWTSGRYSEGDFLKGWMPPHPTFFTLKRLYDKHGTYSLELKSASDYELMLRFIHKHKIRLGYLPRVITKMRVGGESNISLKNRIRANKEDRLAWVMNDLKPGAFTMVRKPLSKLSQFFKK